MSNIKILFYGAGGTGTMANSVEVYANAYDGITIEIRNNIDQTLEVVSLSKQSAIRFSKEIRRKIAEVKYSNQNILKDGE